mmetsp:Transcript_31626/g.98397  ORF Transcript_31626/g.98397 Transcript_31626/m.98397 type:complete len:299 (+) Transcript_31626:48-944(+)
MPLRRESLARPTAAVQLSPPEGQGRLTERLARASPGLGSEGLLEEVVPRVADLLAALGRGLLLGLDHLGQRLTAAALARVELRAEGVLDLGLEHVVLVELGLLSVVPLKAQGPEPRHVVPPLGLRPRDDVLLPVALEPLAALDALMPGLERGDGAVPLLLHAVLGDQGRAAQALGAGRLELPGPLLLLRVDHGLALLGLQRPHLVQLPLLEEAQLPLALLLRGLEGVDGLAPDHGLLALRHPPRVGRVPPVVDLLDPPERGGEVVLAHGGPAALAGHALVRLPRGGPLQGVEAASQGD